ncbi:MAG: response regulator [Chitinispirillaceae bacterium]|nr:response regulator [Chitinispirillaceae bacterium]
MKTTKKVLVLDDEGYMRNMLKDILEDAGYEMISCSNPSITAIRAYKADAIILDLKMSSENEKQGFDVLIHLWEDRECSIPVIIFSAFTNYNETKNDIREIEELYGHGRKVVASIHKKNGVEPLLQTLEDLFNIERLPA